MAHTSKPQHCNCRQNRPNYWQAARTVGESLYAIDASEPAGLLDCLKLGSNLQGFFKALTAAPPSKAWYQCRAAEADQAMPMVGCHVTMQGDAVQWIHAEVLLCIASAYVAQAVLILQTEPTFGCLSMMSHEVFQTTAKAFTAASAACARVQSLALRAFC